MAIVTYGMLAESYPEVFNCAASNAEKAQWEDLSELAETFFCDRWGDKRERIITYWLLAQKELQVQNKKTQGGTVQSIRLDGDGTVTFAPRSGSEATGWKAGLENTYYGKLVLAMYKAQFPLGFYTRVEVPRW